MDRLARSAVPIRPRLSRSWCFTAALALCGCAIEPDPDFPPAIAPLAPASRVQVTVAPIENATPSAEVAQWAYATRRLLIELLERSRRFEVVDPAAVPAAGALTLRFVDVRDEPWLESVVFGAEQEQNRQRRAVVDVEWRFRTAAGAEMAGGKLTSHAFREGAEPILLPTAAELEAGSFWESPFGVATRENLDLIVRRLSERG